MKISEIYGKEVKNEEGKTCGWVRGIIGTAGALQFLQCFDAEEREFNIDVKDVLSFGEHIIFEDRAAAKAECRFMRLGIPAYNESGAFLGYLAEIEQGKNGTKYLIGKKKYSADEVSAGDAVIVHGGRTLKENVISSDGAIVLKKGTKLDTEALKKAEDAGEYFQAQLKTI